MKYSEGFDRRQSILFPVCIEQMIPEDSEVRMIDLFVDTLPLKDLGFMDHNREEAGRPMYHPGVLFKLCVYGYLNRIRTSRLLERECKRNIELIWLLKGLQPCFRTIAGFRSKHPEVFRNTFNYFVQQIGSKGLTGKKLVALDSSKFRAVNSKKNNYNQRKIDRQLHYIDKKVNEYLEELDREDLTDKRREEIEDKIKRQHKNKRKYKRIEKQLIQSGEDQVSTTDTDARSMILHGSVIEVAYNAQTVTDEKHSLVIGYQVTNKNDRKALFPMSVQAQQTCGSGPLKVLADKGYHNGEQIAACEAEQIKTYVSPQDVPRSSEVPLPEFYGEKFKYSKTKDEYTCPEGHKMTTTGNWYKKKYEKSYTYVKHYTTGACKNCEMKKWCTKNPKGRLIERSEYAEAVERNNKRVQKNTTLCSKRQQLIEHVFGTIKRQWGFDHILLKGLRKNDGEFGLIFLIYNFRRVMNIFGAKKLKSWLKSLFLLLLVFINGYRVYQQKFKFSFLVRIARVTDCNRNLKLGYCTN